MTIIFPPTSHGGNRTYENLYLGKLVFSPGSYIVKLPQSDEEWKSMEEIKVCLLSHMDYSYLDISKLQKQ